MALNLLSYAAVSPQDNFWITWHVKELEFRMILDYIFAINYSFF